MNIANVIMPLAAILKELEIGKELSGKKFETHLLKKKYLSVWNKHRPNIFSLIGNEDKSDVYSNAFIYSLNSIIDQDEYIYFPEEGKKAISSFNHYFLITFKFFLENVDEEKDFSELLDELQNLVEKGLIMKEVLNEISKLISSKEYKNVPELQMGNSTDKQFDYAIITVLEEDEMEKVLPLIEKEGEITDSEHLIEYGHLKGMPTKRIVYASQHSSGVIDAGILSTELLLRFKPKFLIMVGVLGGKPLDTNIGDIVVASKVFTIDKGKYNELGFQKEINQSALHSKELTRFNREKSQIENFINKSDETRSSNIKIHFGPIATVNQVIDVEGFFEKEITQLDRKAIALEMESFAVVRACELISRNTKPLIIKSVMDNTSGKTDNAKTYAAWTSAKFLEYVLLNDII